MGLSQWNEALVDFHEAPEALAGLPILQSLLTVAEANYRISRLLSMDGPSLNIGKGPEWEAECNLQARVRDREKRGAAVSEVVKEHM